MCIRFDLFRSVDLHNSGNKNLRMYEIFIRCHLFIHIFKYTTNYILIIVPYSEGKLLFRFYCYVVFLFKCFYFQLLISPLHICIIFQNNSISLKLTPSIYYIDFQSSVYYQIIDGNSTIFQPL